MEENKKPFEIIIKNNGEIVEQMQTDCLLAVFHNVENDGTKVIMNADCDKETTLDVLAGAEDLVMKVSKKEPLFGMLLSLKRLKSFTKTLEENEEKDEQ